MGKNKKTKKKPIRFKKFFSIISIIAIISLSFFLIKLYSIGILSGKILTYVLVGVPVLNLILISLLFTRIKNNVKISVLIIIFLIIGLEAFATYNLSLTTSFVDKIASAQMQEEIFEIYVLNDSKYEKTKDLNQKVIGVYDVGSDTIEEALKVLNKKVNIKKSKTYDDVEKLLKDGIDKKMDALIISNTMSELIDENYHERFQNFRLLDTISVSVKETVKKSEVDITKDSFIVYISGIDTYGSISSVSRSDVNILAVINPNTNKVLLVNTPRDYYVKLHSKKAYDKLTHAGIYGIEESLSTLEDLYSTNIDFYVKVNFSSLIKIVDALGGITVNSKYNFSYDGFTFKKGENKLNGKAALAFSRCRKELPNGDISRGENQEAVIEAIIKKVVSPSIISKYSSILKTLSNSFNTNMEEKDIYSLAKMQLNENPTWNIESENAIGTDAYDITYSGGKTKLYVMKPNVDSVGSIQLKIKETMK